MGGQRVAFFPISSSYWPGLLGTRELSSASVGEALAVTWGLRASRGQYLAWRRIDFSKEQSVLSSHHDGGFQGPGLNHQASQPAPREPFSLAHGRVFKDMHMSNAGPLQSSAAFLGFCGRAGDRHGTGPALQLGCMPTVLLSEDILGWHLRCSRSSSPAQLWPGQYHKVLSGVSKSQGGCGRQCNPEGLKVF